MGSSREGRQHPSSHWCRLACPSVLLLLALIGLQLATAAVGEQPSAVTCPVQYSKHSLDDIRSKAKLPYLLGGIYDSSRQCSNCKRGGLWAEFCSFKALGKSRFYDMQLCNSNNVAAVVDGALKQQYAADLLTMSPCDLWPFLRGRTTWVIGDSMSKDLYKALRCFMVEFQDLHTYHATNNSTAMHFLEAIPGKGEPRCVHMLENTRLCQIHAIEGDLFVAAAPGSNDRTAVGGVLPLIQQHLAFQQDLFIVHFGLWHGETRQEAYKKYLHQLGQYYASTREQFPHMFFMETPKQHFDSEDGDYKVPWITTRKGPWTCQPVKGLSLNPDGSLAAEPGNEVAAYVARGSWRNAHAREVLGQYKLPLIPIYNETATAWALHRHNMDGQECSHFCHPSMPQFWLWHLRNTFRAQGLTPVQEPWKQVPKAGCAVIYDWDEKKYGIPKTADAEAAEKVAQTTSKFWDWLQGRGGKFEVKDGVLLMPPGAGAPAAAAAAVPATAVSQEAGSGGGKAGGLAGLRSWEVLQKLLDLKLLQQPHQQGGKEQEKGRGGSSSKQRPAGARDQQQQKPPSQAAAGTKQQQQGKVQVVKLERGSRRQQQPPAGAAQPRGPRREGPRPQAGGGPPAAGHGDAMVTRHRRKRQQQLHQQSGGAAGGGSGGVTRAGAALPPPQQQQHQQQAGD